MATRQEALDAANKKPAKRSPLEQSIVDDNIGDQAVSNANEAAKETQRVYGTG